MSQDSVSGQIMDNNVASTVQHTACETNYRVVLAAPKPSLPIQHSGSIIRDKRQAEKWGKDERPDELPVLWWPVHVCRPTDMKPRKRKKWTRTHRANVLVQKREDSYSSSATAHTVSSKTAFTRRHYGHCAFTEKKNSSASHLNFTRRELCTFQAAALAA